MNGNSKIHRNHNENGPLCIENCDRKYRSSQVDECSIIDSSLSHKPTDRTLEENFNDFGKLNHECHDSKYSDYHNHSQGHNHHNHNHNHHNHHHHHSHSHDHNHNHNHNHSHSHSHSHSHDHEKMRYGRQECDFHHNEGYEHDELDDYHDHDEKYYHEHCHDDDYNDIDRDRCIDALIVALKVHNATPEVQEQACWTLATFTFGKSITKEHNRDYVMQCSGIEAIIASIVSHMGSINVIRRAFNALANISVGSIERKQRIVDCDGVEAVTNAMRQHPDAIDIQHQGFLVLANLVNKSTRRKAIVCQCHAIDLALAAMQKHDHIETHEFACMLLHNITASTHEDPCPHIEYGTVEARRRRVAELEGIKILVSVLSRFSNANTVVKHVCGILSHLVTSHVMKPRRERLRKTQQMSSVPSVNPFLDTHLNQSISGGLEKIEKIIQKENSKNATVTARANGAQEGRSLSLAETPQPFATKVMDGENLPAVEFRRKLLVDCFGIEKVVDVMKIHKDFPDIQCRGCRILSKMCEETHLAFVISNEVQEKRLEKGNIKMGKKNRRKAKERAELAITGGQVAMSKAVDSTWTSRGERIVQCGGVEAVIFAMENHRGSNPDILNYGCAVLTGIARLSERYKNVVLSSKGNMFLCACGIPSLRMFEEISGYSRD